jgi:hypothetical protein
MKPSRDDIVTWDVQVTRDHPGKDGTHTPLGYLVEWVTVATEVSEQRKAEATAHHYLDFHEYRAARLVRNVTPPTTRTPQPPLAGRRT